MLNEKFEVGDLVKILPYENFNDHNGISKTVWLKLAEKPYFVRKIEKRSIIIRDNKGYEWAFSDIHLEKLTFAVHVKNKEELNFLLLYLPKNRLANVPPHRRESFSFEDMWVYSTSGWDYGNKASGDVRKMLTFEAFLNMRGLNEKYNSFLGEITVKQAPREIHLIKEVKKVAKKKFYNPEI